MDDPPLYELLALHGSDEIGRWSLAPGVYTVGRSRDCSILLEADGVQDEHARLSIDDEGSISLEVGAAGACVDGSSVTGAVRVQPEQYIDLGSISLLLQTGANRTVSLAAAPEEDNEVPAEFRRPDRYEAGQQIAKGGMGAILNVRQSAIRRSVAMKVILDRAEEEPGQRLRFIEEAQITGQLEHPNIVPVHDAGIDAEGRIFYTMKLVKGITLKKLLQLLKEREPGIVGDYPLPALLTVFIKVCDALAFAHSRGVIHRDIKPENIMIGSYGEVLLMDWGLAKLIGARTGSSGVRVPATVLSARAEAAESFATMLGSVMGTPNYMSPEQARGEVEQLDARSDLFSLGIVLHELLTLERPFTGQTAKALLDRIASGEPADPAPLRRPRKPGELPHLPQGVPDSLAAVVLKALAPQPADRYQAVKELQADLTAYQNGFATGAEGASLWRQLRLLVHRHKLASIAAAVILLLVVGFLLKQGADGRRIVLERNRAEQALLRLRGTAPSLFQLAESEALAGRFDSALRKLDDAMALDPGYAPPYWKRASVLIGLKRMNEAAEALHLACARDRSHPEWGGISSSLQKLALASPSSWPADHAQRVYEYLNSIGATAEAAEISEPVKVAVMAGERLVRQRMTEWLGGGTGNVRNFLGRLAVDLRDLPLESLEPLRGLPLFGLSIAHTSVQSLEPLQGMKLSDIDLSDCNVSDLNPLRGMPLQRVKLSGSKVRDLTPLRGSPIEDLTILRLENFEDIVSILQLPRLEKLRIDARGPQLAALRRHSALKAIAPGEQPYQSVEQFWKEFDAREKARQGN